jgi:hypothetical protein
VERLILVLSAPLAALISLADSVQLFGLVMLLAAGLAIGRSRRKDGTIADLEAAIRAQDVLIEVRQKELEGAQARGDREHEQRRECERRISHLEGEITTLERYTAQGALESVAERLGSIESVIVGAIQNQGELILKNTEILAKLDEHLGGGRK